MTLTPFKMSEPARMRVEPLGRRNEPGIRGDDSRSLCRGEDDEIVGDDEGVRGKGEAGGEADPDSGEVFEGTLPNTSLATTGLGGRSTTDGLLLGMGDRQTIECPAHLAQSLFIRHGWAIICNTSHIAVSLVDDNDGTKSCGWAFFDHGPSHGRSVVREVWGKRTVIGAGAAPPAS